MLIATKDGQVIKVRYRYSRDPENDARHEMNSRKRSQEKARYEKNESKDATRFNRDKYLLATRPPVLLMFLQLLSRWVVSWSSHSEDNSPLSIPHLVSCWGIAITIYHTVILNRRIQYKISIASDRKIIQSHY